MTVLYSFLKLTSSLCVCHCSSLCLTPIFFFKYFCYHCLW